MSDSLLTSAESETNTSEIDSEEKPSASSKRKRLLLISIFVAVVWWLVLIWLSTFQANQPILNRIQISQSTDIVIAQVSDLPKGIVEIKETFRGPLKQGQKISVLNLAEGNAKAGVTYVLALFEYENEKWDITPFRSPKTGDALFIIYPPTDSLKDDLKSLLDSFEKQQ